MELLIYFYRFLRSVQHWMVQHTSWDFDVSIINNLEYNARAPKLKKLRSGFDKSSDLIESSYMRKCNYHTIAFQVVPFSLIVTGCIVS